MYAGLCELQSQLRLTSVMNKSRAYLVCERTGAGDVVVEGYADLDSSGNEVLNSLVCFF